jgi:hypothetical protein
MPLRRVNLAWPISLELSASEVAGQVEATNSWMTERMAKLRDDLERLNA